MPPLRLSKYTLSSRQPARLGKHTLSTRSPIIAKFVLNKAKRAAHDMAALAAARALM